jgi:hypothetical protein
VVETISRKPESDEGKEMALTMDRLAAESEQQAIPWQGVSLGAWAVWQEVPWQVGAAETVFEAQEEGFMEQAKDGSAQSPARKNAEAKTRIKECMPLLYPHKGAFTRCRIALQG